MDNLVSLAEQRREPNTARLTDQMDARLLLLPRIGAVPPTGYRSDPKLAGKGVALSGWSAAHPVARAWMTRRVRRVEGKIRDPKSVVEGKSGDLGGRRIIKKQRHN